MEKNKKYRILLVDNDELNRIYFRDIFWIHGMNESYEILSTNSIKEAREIIENEETRPQVLFLDTLIPEKGEKNDIDSQIKRSHDFVSFLKNNETYQNIKIIIYSGQKDRKIEKSFKNQGVDGFLLKGGLLPKEIISFTDKIYETNH